MLPQPLSTIEFPWLHSQSPPRRPPTSWLSSLLDYRTIGVVSGRLSPNHRILVMQSLAKAAISAAQSVSILAHPQSNTLHSDSDGLFDPKLLASFREGAAVLRSRNLNPSLALESDNIKHTVLRMKLLYGPPLPDSGDLVEQKWSRAVRVLVPQREAVFQSTDQQARLLKAAMEQGWVLEADVSVAGKFRYRVEGAGVDDTRRAVIFSLRSAHSHSHAWAADRHVATRAWRVEGIDT